MSYSVGCEQLIFADLTPIYQTYMGKIQVTCDDKVALTKKQKTQLQEQNVFNILKMVPELESSIFSQKLLNFVENHKIFEQFDVGNSLTTF